MTSYSVFLSDPRDYVLLVGLASILGFYGYYLSTIPWEPLWASVVVYGLVGAAILIPFTPWFLLQRQRWS